MSKREGIVVRHRTKRSVMHVVEVSKKPYGLPMLCNLCRITHTVKAVHLHLDDTGACTVSKGVLEELKMAGMPDLVIGGFVKNPPLLTVAPKVSREEVDFMNRRQTIYNGRTL